MNDDHTPAGRSTVAGAVKTLDPGYFALVMGTGIVSVGMHNHGLTAFSDALLWLSASSYLLLVVLTIVRTLLFPAALRSDFDDPRRGFRFFTFVAGTGVLGTRLALSDHRHTALALLAVAWILLGYVVP